MGREHAQHSTPRLCTVGTPREDCEKHDIPGILIHDIVNSHIKCLYSLAYAISLRITHISKSNISAYDYVFN